MSGSKPSKRGKTKKAEGAKRLSHTRRGIDLDLDEESILKEIGKMKAITPYSVASQYDLKVSTAKVLLRRLAEKGVIEVVGGNSRIRIYKAKG